MRLLWTHCCHGNLEMLKYLLGLAGISDPVMADGTTGFAMALARQDSDMVRDMLANKIPSPIDQLQLSRSALLELDSGSGVENARLRQELMNGLRKHDIPHEKISSSRKKIDQQ